MKSSLGANCAGLTKIETTTRRAPLARLPHQRDMAACSAPMVGTSAIVAALRKGASARRSDGTVRTTCGPRAMFSRTLSANCRKIRQAN